MVSVDMKVSNIFRSYHIDEIDQTHNDIYLTNIVVELAASFQDIYNCPLYLELFLLLQMSRFRNLEMVRAPAWGVGLTK